VAPVGRCRLVPALPAAPFCPACQQSPAALAAPPGPAPHPVRRWPARRARPCPRVSRGSLGGQGRQSGRAVHQGLVSRKCHGILDQILAKRTNHAFLGFLQQQGDRVQPSGPVRARIPGLAVLARLASQASGAMPGQWTVDGGLALGPIAASSQCWGATASEQGGHPGAGQLAKPVELVIELAGIVLEGTRLSVIGRTNNLIRSLNKSPFIILSSFFHLRSFLIFSCKFLLFFPEDRCRSLELCFN
jgi:hypothetical protein